MKLADKKDYIGTVEEKLTLLGFFQENRKENRQGNRPKDQYSQRASRRQSKRQGTGLRKGMAVCLSLSICLLPLLSACQRKE